MTDEPTIGEIGRTVARVETDVREMRSEMRQQQATYVTRAEYTVRETAVDREIVQIRESISAGFAELKAQKAPWWVMLTSAIAVVTLILLLIEKTAT